MRQRDLLVTAGLFLALAAGPSGAQNVLNNGPGPGALAVTVDGWGMFGGCYLPPNMTDLMYTTALGAGISPSRRS